MSILKDLVWQIDCNTRGRGDGNILYDWVNGNLGTWASGEETTTVVPSKLIGVRFSNQNRQITWNGNKYPLSASWPLSSNTIACRYKAGSAVDTGQALITSQASDDWKSCVKFGFNSNYNLIFEEWDDYGNYRACSHVNNYSNSAEQVYVITHDGLGNGAAWVNKIQTNTVSNLFTQDISNLSTLSVGNIPSLGNSLNGDIIWAAIWTRKLSNSEIGLLSEYSNPFSQLSRII